MCARGGGGSGGREDEEEKKVVVMVCVCVVGDRWCTAANGGSVVGRWH